MTLADKGPVCFLSGWTYAHLGGGGILPCTRKAPQEPEPSKSIIGEPPSVHKEGFWKVFQLVKGPELNIDRPTLLFPDKTG